MSAAAPSGSLFSHVIAHSPSARSIRAGVVLLATTLTAMAAQFSVPLPFTAVPFVLTPMVVLLSGAVLGSRLGAVSQVLYLIAGMSGLAVFAPSLTLPPGAGRLVGPTGGYLMAYPLAAFVTGWLAERGWDRRYLTAAAAMLAGLAIIFAGGVSWIAITVTRSLPAAAATGFLPFVLFDLLKIAAAAAILPQAWTLVGARRSRGTDTEGNPRG
jgi:biotin transport system substrate-specific component